MLAINVKERGERRPVRHLMRAELALKQATSWHVTEQLPGGKTFDRDDSAPNRWRVEPAPNITEVIIGSNAYRVRAGHVMQLPPSDAARAHGLHPPVRCRRSRCPAQHAARSRDADSCGQAGARLSPRASWDHADLVHRCRAPAGAGDSQQPQGQGSPPVFTLRRAGPHRAAARLSAAPDQTSTRSMPPRLARAT